MPLRRLCSTLQGGLGQPGAGRLGVTVLMPDLGQGAITVTDNPADDVPQSERRRILANDKKVREGSTFHAHAIAELSDVGGRFANVQPTSVTGSSPSIDVSPTTYRKSLGQRRMPT